MKIMLARSFHEQIGFFLQSSDVHWIFVCGFIMLLLVYWVHANAAVFSYFLVQLSHFKINKGSYFLKIIITISPQVYICWSVNMLLVYHQKLTFII